MQNFSLNVLSLFRASVESSRFGFYFVFILSLNVVAVDDVVVVVAVV